MRRRICVLLLLHLVLVPAGPAETTRVRKKTPKSRPCLDLPEEILEQMFGRLSVGVMGAFHHALELEPRGKLNLTCPTAALRRTDSNTRLPANLRSISPWAYRLSYEPNRYPRYIPEAYCLCKGCLFGPYREESQQYRSVPVYAPTVILRRSGSCVGGRHSYSEIYVSVAVGCTCVPMMEKKRDSQSSNRSLEGPKPKARQIFSAGKKD
ncbi:PREDICTED: interleukin-17D [Cyprinodon variegatus]|uniref:Interleukin 17d n=1 Tax=Cyprinodon variegatus TaxID=28743 RepID=A0A3Q2G0A4_CYPVA|nr:PREDICTED: interleukin-17D [Cyprinodon variegatus]